MSVLNNIENNSLYDISVLTNGVNTTFPDPYEASKILPPFDSSDVGNILMVNNSTSGVYLDWNNVGSGGTLPINTALMGDGSVSNPSVSFQNDTNTGIYRIGNDNIGISTNGIKRLDINNTDIQVGTTTNNLNLVINGNTSAERFYAGNGTASNPSFSFKTSGGEDTGISYDFSGGADRLKFYVGGTSIGEMNQTQTFINQRFLSNGNNGTSSVPALIFHNDSQTTGYSGNRTNPSTDPRLWAVVNGIQSTELTTTNFNIGLTNSNNANMKTLNQNGPSNFNSFTTDYNLILKPSTTTGISVGANFLFGVDVNESNGVFIISSSVTTAGQPRLYVSGISGSANYLTTFTTITDSVLTGSNNWRSVAFGNNVWAVASHNAGGRTLFYTTNTLGTSGWIQVANSAPWTTSRTIIRLKFINGQFVILYAGSIIRVSTDCVTWSEITINATSYALQDIEYSPELRRYVIATRSLGFLYFDGTSLPTTGSNMFTFVSVINGTTNTIAWSSKLGMFLSRDASGLYTYSRDGINWLQYTSTTLGTYNFASIKWINDFGGLFIDIVFQASNNCVVSRDGFNWVSVPLTMTNVAIFFAYNRTNKHFLFTGTGTAHFRDVNSLFNSYVDSDNIYNIFNSNIQFNDTLEYKSLVFTPQSGDNHFTISTFNKPNIEVNTTNANMNIYMQGQSYNGKLGTTFTIYKYASSNHNVRIHGYETTNIISPFGNITGFNFQSSPQFYNIIPAGYFGSFDIIRVSDVNNGTWIIKNLNIYDSSGTRREIGNLSIASNLIVDGTFNAPTVSNKATIIAGGSATSYVYDNTNTAPATLLITTDASVMKNVTLGNLGANYDGFKFEYLFSGQSTSVLNTFIDFQCSLINTVLIHRLGVIITSSVNQQSSSSNIYTNMPNNARFIGCFVWNSGTPYWIIRDVSDYQQRLSGIVVNTATYTITRNTPQMLLIDRSANRTIEFPNLNTLGGFNSDCIGFQVLIDCNTAGSSQITFSNTSTVSPIIILKSGVSVVTISTSSTAIAVASLATAKTFRAVFREFAAGGYGWFIYEN